MWVKYVILILFTTLVSYACAILLERATSLGKKKVLLSCTVVASLGVLIFFKYFNFIGGSIVAFLNSISIQVHPFTLKLLLPVGISFYTFQTLGYVIDVYRNQVRAERNFGEYAAFVSFFPQLVAGPIERTRNLLPQIKGRHEFDYSAATYGLRLMAWGFFKKIIVADTLAVYVDIVYGNLAGYSGFALVIASFFFAVQIYCDFSGYSDIAIGTSKLFGINLMTNFRSPYFSSSIREFWSRWHISLSTWFKDYLYIPLGGNRVSKPRHAVNIMITFLLSGLWHGANWSFVVWGGIHGTAQVMESLLHDKNRPAPKNGFSVFLVFSFCTMAWVFFRAPTFGDAMYVFKNSISGITHPMFYLLQGRTALRISVPGMVRIFSLILAVAAYDFASLKYDLPKCFARLNIVIRWIIYILFVDLIILLYNEFGIDDSAFLYFQF